MSVKEFNDQVAEAHEAAQRAIEEAQNELSLVGAEVRIVPGKPAEAICHLASELSAEAVVVGSRGRGGLKRLFLGSVSDHVVRNAPCSVVVTKSSLP